MSLKGPEKPSMEFPVANVSNTNGFRFLFLLLQASIMVDEAMAETTLSRFAGQIVENVSLDFGSVLRLYGYVLLRFGAYIDDATSEFTYLALGKCRVREVWMWGFEVF